MDTGARDYPCVNWRSCWTEIERLREDVRLAEALEDSTNDCMVDLRDAIRAMIDAADHAGPAAVARIGEAALEGKETPHMSDDGLEVELNLAEIGGLTEEDDSVTAQTMRRIREEWEAPLREQIAVFRDTLGNALTAVVYLEGQQAMPDEGWHRYYDPAKRVYDLS